MGLLTQTQQQYYDSNNFGGYQFTSIDDIISQFLVSYVGEGKIIPKVKRTDVIFHAKRALQELSYDTLKSCKAQEIEVPASLTMPLPHDYVNYIKLTWSDSAGIEHVLYPTSKTSNPTPVYQNSDGDYTLTSEASSNPGTNWFDLDGEYPQVMKGMKVYAPYIEGLTSFTNILTVFAVKNASGITSVALQTSSAPTPFTGLWTPTSQFSTTLTFSNPDGSIIQQAASSSIVEALTWANGDILLTATSTASIANVKVGMEVSNRHFPMGTTVVSINGLVITVSSPATGPSATGDDVTFLSFDKISDTWSKYKSATPSENNNDDYEDDTFWPIAGERYGLDPQHAQVNGSFFIDDCEGLIHFSSNLSGKTIILHYLSDNLGTDGEMIINKFAEEAIYKWIAYAIVSTRANIQEYIVNRFRKEKFAATRKAKLRLSNIKLEELTRILRGKSKQIKH